MKTPISHAPNLQMLAAVVENSCDFIGLYTPQMGPFFVNKAGRKLVGLDPDQDVSQTGALDHVWPEDRVRLEQEAIPALMKGECWTGEVRFRHFQTGKPIPTLWNAFAIKDKDEKIIAFAAICPDLTELKGTQHQLARKAEELEHFVSLSSHDLQEPLRKIMTFGDMLKMRYETQLDESGVKYINVMADSARRMLALITDLLAYSRVTKGKDELTDVDLNTVVASVLNDLDTRIKEREATITVEKLPTLQANKNSMEQLFLNLIGNALKYHDNKKPVIKIWAERKGHQWQLAVQDNGIGIDPKYHKKIFEVFQRLHAKNEYGGTGVGLAICQKIVERFGGIIWVDSKPGAGSTFYCTLPA